MKRLLYIIRLWLLDVLGGVPKPHYDYLHGLLRSERKDFDALCHDYNEEIEDYLNHFPARSILADSAKTNYAIYSAINPQCRIIDGIARSPAESHSQQTGNSRHPYGYAKRRRCIG